MPLSSLDFLSLDNPPTLTFDPLPTCVPDKYAWMPKFLATPRRPQGPTLTPAEMEEANLFVDSVFADCDEESEAKTTNIEVGVGVTSQDKEPSKNNVVATLEDGGTRKPMEDPEIPDLAPMEAKSTAKSVEVSPLVPTEEKEDDVVVERPKDLPDDWHVIGRIRKLGKTAGHMDKYYIQKETGRKLRSMKLVRHFLKTGSATIPKPKKKVGEGNSRVSEDKSKGKAPLENKDNGKMPASVLP